MKKIFIFSALSLMSMTANSAVVDYAAAANGGVAFQTTTLSQDQPGTYSPSSMTNASKAIDVSNPSGYGVFSLSAANTVAITDNTNTITTASNPNHAEAWQVTFMPSNVLTNVKLSSINVYARQDFNTFTTTTPGDFAFNAASTSTFSIQFWKGGVDLGASVDLINQTFNPTASLTNIANGVVGMLFTLAAPVTADTIVIQMTTPGIVLELAQVNAFGTAVPAPPVLAMLVAGLIGFGVSRRKSAAII
jgi:hypothetical protein